MNQRIRWGVIGAGSKVAGDWVIPAILKCPEAQLVALASRERDTALAIADRCGVDIATYGDYDSLIADDSVDAVYIPLPNNLHAGWAIDALNNGKHVLCEQPLAMNAAEAREMALTAEENGVVLSEAFMHYYHPLQLETYARAQRGDIGTLRFIRASCSFPLTRANDFRRQSGMGGGALMDLGGFCVHIARSVFQSEPLEAAAFADWDASSGIDCSMTGSLRFSDGRFAGFDCSLAQATRSSYEIVGDEGSISVPEFCLSPNQPGSYRIKREGGETEEISVEPTDMYLAEICAFTRFVRGERTLLLSPEDASANMAALDALASSAREGCFVSVESV